MADEERDYLHIGNLVEIMSTVHGYVVGRIIYRSDRMVRVMPQEASDRAIEFPLDADGEFDPALGVETVEIIEEQLSDYYVDFLGARPGEHVEFFTIDGAQAEPPGEVAEVIKTASKDSLRLTDGRVIRFRGVGPEPPIAVVRVRSALNTGAAVVAEGAEPTAEADAEKEKEDAVDILALLRSVAPPSTLEYVGTAKRVIPDSMQREDLFQDLLGQMTAKQRTNPRRIRFIEREVDIAMSLKQRAAERDEAGTIIGPTKSNTINTVAEAIAASSGALPAAIPVVEGARVLNLDSDPKKMTPENIQYEAEHVLPRYLADVELQSESIAALYAEGAMPEGLGHAFTGFTQDLFSRDQRTLEGPRPVEWRTDQDVIRTAPPDVPVQGFPRDLPSRDAVTKETAAPVSLAFLSTNVQDRTLRMLGPDRVRARGSGEMLLIAPTDPSRVLSHVMLPIKAALTLRPPTAPGHLPTALLYSERLQDDNLPTIARTLRDLYAPADSASPLVAWSMDPAAATDAPVADWLAQVLRYAVHPSNSLGPRTPELLGLLDSMGLEARAISPAVKSVLDDWVAAAQAQWKSLLNAERERVKALLDAEPERTFQSVTGLDSPAWAALLAEPALADVREDIARRNPTISGAPLALTAGLLMEAQGDAQPIVWATLAGRPLDMDPKEAAAALAASRSYQLRRAALRSLRLLGLRAEPEINPCEHVERLEAVRNVADPLNRARLLRSFIEEYQGGKSGNWITCTLCAKPCVCFHEVMELEALAQPARMDAILKQMVIRFGGERYEGSIICTNCGQGLQAIDYDDHVEFDDNGRPIVESSVLTAEQLEDPEESSWKASTAALVAAPIQFPTEAQRQLYEILTLISERGGFTLPESAARMVVQYADVFVTAKTPPQAAYEAKRKQAMASASTRISTKAGLTAPPEIPTYAGWIDRLRIQAVTGLTIIALQTATPAIVVNSSSPICRYSIGGWPLQPDAKPEEGGTTQYMACVVASIQRDSAPWSNLRWSGEVKLEARIRAALKEIVPAMELMLVGDPKTGPLPFTPTLRQLLTQIQTDAAVAQERAIVSVRDQLPLGFRPAPFPPAVGRPGIERDPLPPIQAALAAGQSVAPMVEPVAAAVRQQAMAVVSELHADATAGLEARKGQIHTNDTVCCAVPLMAADRDAALLGRPVAPTLAAARELLRGGIPTAPNAGTHLWDLPRAPEVAEVRQQVDAGVYFKLFLKYCYRGPQVGEAHEFSVGNVCRQCGFALGKPLDLVDVAAEGAGIIAAQQGDLRVETSEAAFDALSDAVRRRRLLRAGEIARARAPWREGLEAVLVAASTEEGLRGVAAVVGTVLETVRGREDEPLDEMGRATLWGPLTELMDQLTAEISAAMTPRRATTKAAAAIPDLLRQLDRLVEDPFVEGPRTAQEYWCAKAEAVGNNYSIASVRASRWFRISQVHNERLAKVLKDTYQWFAGDVSPATRTALSKSARALGPVLRVWTRSVRSGSGAWTTDEARAVLKALLLQAWRDLVVSDSWIYREMSSPSDRIATAAGAAEWVRALMTHIRQQTSRLDREGVAKVLQQRAEMERTSVVEEFSAIKDDDQRAAELIKKRLRIGRWALGAKGFREYDADIFEFENEQRLRMGIVDPPVDPILLGAAAPVAELPPPPEDGYDMNLAEDGAEY